MFSLKYCILYFVSLISICQIQNNNFSSQPFRPHLLRRPSVPNSSILEFHFCHRVRLARRIAPPAPVKLKCHTEFSTCGLWKRDEQRCNVCAEAFYGSFLRDIITKSVVCVEFVVGESAWSANKMLKGQESRYD